MPESSSSSPGRAGLISGPTAIVKASQEDILKQLLAGQEVPGSKLERSRGLSKSFRKMADAVQRRGGSQRTGRQISFKRKSLKQLLSRRSTVDDLQARGIFKNAAVFGCALAKQTLDKVRVNDKTLEVPRFIWKVIKKLESKQEHLETDGLFRVPGDAAKIQKLRLEIDQDKWETFDTCDDANVLAGSLKLFLRELPEPLLPFSLHSELVLAAKGEGSHGANIAQSIDDILDKVDGVNQDCLEILCLHLGKVAHTPNRMDVDNLGLLFGQVLLWPDPKAPVDMKYLTEAAKNYQVAVAMIRYGADIFADSDPED